MGLEHLRRSLERSIDDRAGCTALILAQLWAPDYPIPLGVMANEPSTPIYEDILLKQEQKVIADRGPGDIAALLRAGETWTIK